MNLPKKNFKIKLSPYIVDVLYVKKCKSETKERIIFGTWNFERLQIELSLSKTKNPQQLENTFIHEIFHALFDTTGLDSIKKIEEEIVCDRLAHGFQAFINDNPKLFK